MARDSSTTYEAPEVRTSVVLGAVFGFLAFSALSIGGIALWYSHAGVNLFVPPRAFPAPRLETRNGQDLARLLPSRTDRATGYAWADRKAGLIRIPVARAMEILAGRGAKAYDPPDPPPSSAGVAP